MCGDNRGGLVALDTFINTSCTGLDSVIVKQGHTDSDWDGFVQPVKEFEWMSMWQWDLTKLI